MKAISDHLLADLDARLAEAIRRVEEGAATAGVSLTFSVKRDKEGMLAFAYSLKGGHAKKGEWIPPPQAPLPFDPTAPDEEADAEAKAWRPPLAEALNLKSGPGGVPDFEGGSEVITHSFPERFTAPVYRRLGQVTRHRLRVSGGMVTEEPVCGSTSGEGLYSAVPEGSGAECRDCARLVGELAGEPVGETSGVSR